MANLKIFPQKILDCGEIKYLGDINMKPKYILDFENKLLEARTVVQQYEYLFEGSTKRRYPSKEAYERSADKIIVDKYNEIHNDEFIMEYINFPDFDKYFQKGSDSIARYMGVEPYVTSVMINISPNWKGKYGQDKLTDKLMTKKFCQVIDTYLSASNRYSKYKYCLECGSEGNFLHAHIVAEFNKQCIKSVTTHINKGNHTVELRKIWDKIFPEGYVGLIKGKFAVQRIILRVDYLRQDKLDYLVEDKKPEGHKNLRDLNILKNEGF